MLTKKCIRCGIEKSLDQYYNNKKIKGGKNNVCIECDRKRRKIYDKKREEKEGFQHKVLPNPGEFYDQKQKEDTEEILEAIGWKYCKKTNVWYKLPKKNRYGNWIFEKKVKKYEPIFKKGNRFRLHTNTIIIERKKELAEPPPNYKRLIGRNDKRQLTDEQFEEIRKMYQQPGMTQCKIANHFGVAQSYINQIIHYKK